MWCSVVVPLSVLLLLWCCCCFGDVVASVIVVVLLGRRPRHCRARGFDCCCCCANHLRYPRFPSSDLASGRPLRCGEGAGAGSGGYSGHADAPPGSAAADPWGLERPLHAIGAFGRGACGPGGRAARKEPGPQDRYLSLSLPLSLPPLASLSLSLSPSSIRHCGLVHVRLRRRSTLALGTTCLACRSPSGRHLPRLRTSERATTASSRTRTLSTSSAPVPCE